VSAGGGFCGGELGPELKYTYWWQEEIQRDVSVRRSWAKWPRKDIASLSAGCRACASRLHDHYRFFAADCLFENLDALAEEGVVVEVPRPETCSALQIVKETALKCAELFGSSKRGDPVGDVDQSALPSISSHLQRKTGLQLDVERLFKENVSILPETLDEVDFSAHYVSFNVLKIIGGSLLEYYRLHALTAQGFSQLQLDVELIKHLVGHYVKGDFSPNGTDACVALKGIFSDVLLAAGEHCAEEGYAEDGEVLRETRQKLHVFLTGREQAVVRDTFIIESE
jgi:hypothetical protein